MEKNKLQVSEKDINDRVMEYIADIFKSASYGILNPLIDLILPSKHQQRFIEWCQSVKDAIVELNEKGLTIDKLRDDEQFISLLKESMIAASKTHQEEKHGILKDALFKHFVSDEEFDEKIMYIKLIDTLTLSHIHVLFLLNKYHDVIKDIDIFNGVVDIIKLHLTASYMSNDMYAVIVNDLEKSKLLEVSPDMIFDITVKQSIGISGGYNNPDSSYIIVTSFGKRFLAYILKN
jgi:hypothetical protein